MGLNDAISVVIIYSLKIYIVISSDVSGDILVLDFAATSTLVNMVTQKPM